ncbi:heme-binding protein [Cyanobium sp. HWJ4-Hawea]|nr:heme-binding protein [Cyanobium sp. WAJ14-Wanaka]MCP9808758.1 heme-binding protein [Cyanobium sp. HWJ4-Hawea]
MDVAVETCRQKGYGVTATVVNQEGSIVAVLRGDRATPHTVEHSFNKAYTTITLGPILKTYSTADIIEVFEKQHRQGIGDWALPPIPIKGITFNIGGVGLFANTLLIGSIGVSGAPDGHIDQECAFKGRDAANAVRE